MKQCVLMVALLGCAHAAPPWPKPSVSDVDGGESLAPREPKFVAAADKETKSDDKADKPSDDQKASPADDKKTTPPATEPDAESTSEPQAETSSDEPDEETIVIEVEEEASRPASSQPRPRGPR